MKTCCIAGCFNSSGNSNLKYEGIKFYHFPLDNVHMPWLSDKRKKWLNAIKKYTRNPTTLSKDTVICSAHFIGNKKSEHPQHPSYIPTIFPNKKQEEHLNKKKLQRFERHQRRMQQAGSFIPEKHTTRYDSVKQKPKEPFTKTFGCQTVLCENETYTPYFICNLTNVNGACTAEVQANIVTKIMRDKSCEVNITAVNKVMKDFSCDPLDQHSQSVHCPGFHGVSSMKSEEDFISSTGVTSSVFNLLLSLLPERETKTLSKEKKLLITLMKLKTGLCFSALSVIFQIHRTTVQRTFETYLFILQDALKKIITWPTKSTVQENMPESFKRKYPNTRVIIDCTEAHTECPPTVEQRVHMYSEYKHNYTIKFLVACTPCGYISFVSKCYGGRCNDCFITKDCGVIDLLEPGDTVFASKSFSAIKTLVEKKKASLVMPPFNEPKFSPEEVEIQKIASVPFYIVRVIQRIKKFHIFDKIPISLLKYRDLIVYVVCALVNIENPITKQNVKNHK